MSPLAWKMLSVFIEQVNRYYKREFDGRGYISAWSLCDMMCVGRGTIQGATVQHVPQNEYEQALHDLIELGLVEEMTELPERFRLVVKEEQS